MARALKYDIPGRDFRIRPEQVLAEGWAKLFANTGTSDASGGASRCGRLVVEIGYGRGEFLIDQALRDPDVDFVGIELSYKRSLKMARRLACSDLTNIRLLEMRAERAVVELFAWNSVECFWINFPDPWPKKRHAARRLFQPEFVREMALRLRPGGAIYAATDDPDYAAQIGAALAGDALLSNAYAPRPCLPEVPGRLATSFELEWRAVGRDLHYFMYTRR